MSWYLIRRRKTAPREARNGADPGSGTHSADTHEDAPARPPYRNAAVVLAIAIGMGAIFATSYSLFLGRATPHHITIGLVGSPAGHAALLVALRRATHGGLAFRRYGTIAGVRQAIDQQVSFGALTLGQGSPRLLVSSASGASVAQLLERAAEQITQTTRQHIVVVDLHPLPPSDPQGLVSFYVTLASSIVGFVTMFQLRANAPGLGLRAWLASIAALAVVGGLVLALVADPLIGALHGPFPELWLALTAEITVAALFCSAMLTLVHRWAIIPTWLLFVVLGNTSSGGAVALPLLPSAYAFIGRFLPPGATVSIIRTAVYFAHYQHPEPFIVQAVWFACTLAALLISVRVLRRGPWQ